MTDNTFKFIDLFAGIGGIRIPFEEFGGSCIFSSEFDRFAKETYVQNFGELPNGDITEIDEKVIPKHDLLLAGFPCQAFSHAGLKKGFNDTRGTLFYEIVKILKYHMPSAFLLENVKGLRSHDAGRTIETIEKVLKDLGYYTDKKVLNAKNFGLPQNRERIFIVGFKNDYNLKTFQWPICEKKEVRIGDILSKTRVPNKYTISDKLWDSHQKRKIRNQEMGKGFGYKIFDRSDEYTSTLSARYYKDGSEILIRQKNKNPRKLTPREAARLQGFPDTFKITVSDTQAYKQFGNSVPINVIRAIAKNLVPVIQKIVNDKK